MIDDFAPPARRKPKVIDPIEKEPKGPLPPLEDEPTPEEFHTPEEVADTPEVPEPGDRTELEATEAKLAHNVLTPDAKADKKRWHHHVSSRWPFNKKQSLLIAAVILLLIAGGVSYALTRPNVKAGRSVIKTKVVVKKPVVPTTVASTLTGLPVDPAVNDRPVTGVMIENSTDARPQSGLNQAGVVFEAIAEGGITRFLTLYQDSQPDYLGPVRSARPYYVQWCMGFDCSLAHAGGSPEALANIKSWGTKNLDQFANSGAFNRISSRYAPHNLYTSTAQLNQLEASKGYGKSTYTGFAHKKDAPSKAPTAGSIDLALSGFYYNAHFDYDAATDSYKRSQAGAPHMALNKDGTQVQIQPKVVVAMVMQYGLEADDHHSQYNVIGSGQAYVFQDGTVTPATWSKTDIKNPLTLVDAAGKPIALNPGQTWLTAVGATNQVAYK